MRVKAYIQLFFSEATFIFFGIEINSHDGYSNLSVRLKAAYGSNIAWGGLLSLSFQPPSHQKKNVALTKVSHRKKYSLPTLSGVCDAFRECIPFSFGAREGCLYSHTEGVDSL